MAGEAVRLPHLHTFNSALLDIGKIAERLGELVAP
jgi:hypothetical protein